MRKNFGNLAVVPRCGDCILMTFLKRAAYKLVGPVFYMAC